jgi:hypothetical protein
LALSGATTPEEQFPSEFAIIPEKQTSPAGCFGGVSVGEFVVGAWVGATVVGEAVGERVRPVGEAVEGFVGEALEGMVGEAVGALKVGEMVEVGDWVVPVNQMGTPSYPLPLPHIAPASATETGRRQSLAPSVSEESHEANASG